MSRLLRIVDDWAISHDIVVAVGQIRYRIQANTRGDL